jgi:hypothetical protein
MPKCLVQFETLVATGDYFGNTYARKIGCGIFISSALELVFYAS